MADTVGKPQIIKKGKQHPKGEGSPAEELKESPSFERIEDAHDETTQIKPGTARHAQLSKIWGTEDMTPPGGPNRNKVKKTTVIPAPTK